MHITPTLASAIQWAAVNPSAGQPYRDGPALNAHIATLAGNGTHRPARQHVLRSHPAVFRHRRSTRDNVALANEFLTNIYKHRAELAGVLDPGAGQQRRRARQGRRAGLRLHVHRPDAARGKMVRPLVRARHATAIASTASTATNCFVINDGYSGYMFQNDDNGLPILLRDIAADDGALHAAGSGHRC